MYIICMVTKNQKKVIRSLKQKKNRKSLGFFVAEGIKVINEFLDTHLELQELYVLESEIELFLVISIISPGLNSLLTFKLLLLPDILSYCS